MAYKSRAGSTHTDIQEANNYCVGKGSAPNRLLLFFLHRNATGQWTELGVPMSGISIVCDNHVPETWEFRSSLASVAHSDTRE